jgi:hypothetical protein
MQFKSFLQELLETRKLTLFLLICLLSFALLLVKKNYIELASAAFQILDDRGELGFFKILSGLQFATIPIIYLWKFTVIAFIVWVGSFMYGYKLTYSKSWHLIMAGELIFIIAELIKILWILVFMPQAEYAETRAFYPLSLMNLVDYTKIAVQYHYPLKSLNVFEVAYWFFLVFGVHTLVGKRLKTSYAIVFSSYVLFFLLWLLVFIGVYK